MDQLHFLAANWTWASWGGGQNIVEFLPAHCCCSCETFFRYIAAASVKLSRQKCSKWFSPSTSSLSCSCHYCPLFLQLLHLLRLDKKVLYNLQLLNLKVPLWRFISVQRSPINVTISGTGCGVLVLSLMSCRHRVEEMKQIGHHWTMHQSLSRWEYPSIDISYSRLMVSLNSSF